MTDRYGPQTTQIEALLDRVCNLTDEEAKALRTLWTPTWVAARVSAWEAARAAGRIATRRVPSVTTTAWTARDAVLALVVRHLIGQHGFTQEHYDTLVAPWESVIGTEWTREATDE